MTARLLCIPAMTVPASAVGEHVEVAATVIDSERYPLPVVVRGILTAVEHSAIYPRTMLTVLTAAGGHVTESEVDVRNDATVTLGTLPGVA